MVKAFRLAYSILITMALLCNSCDLKPDKVEGTYFHDVFGNKYSLILSDGKFMQTLINGNDTFVNSGVYSLSNVVSLDAWKEKDELTDSSIGGCVGCELKYKDGKLLYYTDPDNGPVEIFIKQ